MWLLHHHLRRRFTKIVFLAFICLCAACGGKGFAPPKVSSDLQFKKKLASETEGGITVTVGVPSRQEAALIFDADVYSHNMQPLWVRVTNETDQKLIILPSSIDQEYYSPNEAAYKTKSGYSKKGQKAREHYFNEKSLPYHIPPLSQSSGYIFTRLDEGNQYVTVDILTGNDLDRFNFILDVKYMDTRYKKVGPETVYASHEIKDLSLSELRQELAALPCCTAGPNGQENGNPLNIVIIGDNKDALGTLIRTGWRRKMLEQGRDTTRSSPFLNKRPYKYEGDGIAMLWGREPDVIFEEPREKEFENNLLRVWLSPWRYEGQNVFVGSLTRNIGLRHQPKRAYLVIHHKIDPAVDEIRELLLEEFISIGAVESVGWARAMDPVPPQTPKYNYFDDHWFTDGLLLVLMISGEPVHLRDVVILDWELPRNIPKASEKTSSLLHSSPAKGLDGVQM
jgi:hypothetical protein